MILLSVVNNLPSQTCTSLGKSFLIYKTSEDVTVQAKVIPKSSLNAQLLLGYESTDNLVSLRSKAGINSSLIVASMVVITVSNTLIQIQFVLLVQAPHCNTVQFCRSPLPHSNSNIYI
jgi:hypothetical protein